MRRAWMLLALAACARPSDRPMTAVSLRAAVLGIDAATLSADRRAALERGLVVAGAPEDDVYLARGQPILWWHTAGDGGACKVFVEASLKDPAIADLAITTCGGAVTQVAPIEPALPCWRLAAVAPRVTADAAFFEGLPLERQWQLVAGILRRGQTSRELAIALGPPHNHGLEEREDGVRADEQVFLDASGDAYGLRVTLVDDRVVGWKVPSERRLTPEAEQRRLAALEQRLTTKLSELEQRSIQQHAETMSQFTTVMQHQDTMLARLSERSAPPPTVVIEAPPSSDPRPTRTDRNDRNDRTDRSDRTDNGLRPPPPGIKLTVEKKEIPWGKTCREASDDCAPGSCHRLTAKSSPTCTRTCKTRGERCAPGYTCKYETVAEGARLFERGFLLCRPD